MKGVYIHIWLVHSSIAFPRYKIILNLGRALQYLHEDCSVCVLHGDIKSSNILLDSRFVAKLADFGLARIIDHEIELKTTCNIAGMLGYVDPDFVTTGKRSRESDVYSFGMFYWRSSPGGARL